MLCQGNQLFLQIGFGYSSYTMCYQTPTIQETKDAIDGYGLYTHI
jgi:hypothetical protein